MTDKHSATSPADVTATSEIPPVAGRRKPERPEDRVLSATAETWLDSLPPDIRPVQLVKTFPRICNCLAEYWDKQAIAKAYFDDLLVDKREGRQGFPLSIVMEITNLKKHFLATSDLEEQDIWESAPGRY